jgi:hypothetical protein
MPIEKLTFRKGSFSFGTSGEFVLCKSFRIVLPAKSFFLQIIYTPLGRGNLVAALLHNVI